MAIMFIIVVMNRPGIHVIHSIMLAVHAIEANLLVMMMMRNNSMAD